MKSSDRLEVSIAIDFPKFRLDVAESIPLDGVTALVGESGAGKSTMLRVIAGIERSAKGTVRFRDRTWMDSDAGVFVPTHRRAVGIVFQEGRLFSHLDVKGNLGYGYRRNRGRDGPGWDEVCDALDLDPLMFRKVQTLSGGEQQRVALGRALLSAPELLLLDEPLASLDTDSKDEIIPYLRRVISTFRLPAIYISHSREELRTLVDNILTIRGGKIAERNGGEMDSGQRQLLNATMGTAVGGGMAFCRIGSRQILVRVETPVEEGTEVMLAFLDSDLAVSDAGAATGLSAGAIPATVNQVRTGARHDAVLTLATAGGPVMARVHFMPGEDPDLGEGRTLELIFVRAPHLMV